MIFFNRQNKLNKFKSLLAKQTDFPFDASGIKRRLMTSLAHQPVQAPTPTFTHRMWVKRLSWGTGVLSLFLIAGTALAVANNAKPGDLLYPLDKWQESIWVNLPLPQAQKAQIQTNLVQERVKELEQVQNSQDDQIKASAVKETERSLSQAVEEISKTRNKIEAARNEKLEQMDKLLDRLNSLAEEQEGRIEKIDIEDDKIRENVDQDLIKIRSSKNRIRSIFNRKNGSNEELDQNPRPQNLEDTTNENLDLWRRRD